MIIALPFALCEPREDYPVTPVVQFAGSFHNIDMHMPFPSLKRKMIRSAITFLCVSFCMASLADDLAGRPQLPLSGQWEMQFAERADGGIPQTWDAKPFSVPDVCKLPEGKGGLWLMREVDVPAAWAGSRVVLHIGHPLYTAEVFANGAAAGEIPGFGGEADISKQVRFGEKNTICVFFPREGGASLAADKWASRVITDFSPDNRSKVGILGLASSVYLERQSPDIVVSDVWYRTFTRGSERVEPLVTVRAAHPILNVRAQVTIYAPDKPVVVARADLSLGSVPGGESQYSVKIPAANLKLWGLREPNLYRGQVVLYDALGKELDRSAPVDFGIREFWIDGKDFYLNNQHINFTFNGFFFHDLKDALKAGVTLTCTKHAANGINLIYDNEDDARQCDELGIGFIAYGASLGYQSPSLTDPATLAAYRVWVQAHLQKWRNHPSILFWVLSTNMGGGDIFNPTTIGRSAFLRGQHHAQTAISYDEHRKADDTRPSYHHSSVGTADMDTGNVYFNHLPLQSVEDWMSAWKEKGDRPYFFCEYVGGPLEQDYLKSNALPPFVSYVTEYTARLSGDRAYQKETPAYLDYSSHAVPRLGRVWDYDPVGYCPVAMEQYRKTLPETYLACRYYGVPAHLFFFPLDPKKALPPDDPRVIANKELVQITTDLLRPNCYWIGGPEDEWTSKAHQFHAGDTITKSVLCIGDQPKENQITVKWDARLSDGGTVIASGTQSVTIGPWSRKAVQFQFKAPPNSSSIPLPLDIQASVSEANGAAGTVCEPFHCTIWPRENPPVPGSQVFSVFDPEGETTAWLKKEGVRIEPFVPGTLKPLVLVIGRRALHGLDKLPFTAADIHAGTRVLVCEQYCGDLEKMGFRTEDFCPRTVFVRCAEHPILAGLSNDALHDWSGNATLLPWGPEGDTTHVPNSRRSYHWSNRGTVVSNMIETPQFGPFKAIADCEFDLGYTPLLSWRHGAGEVIFCQLDITGRSVDDPAVERIKRNVVKYFETPLAPPAQNRTVVCASDTTLRQIAALGYSAEPWRDSPDPAGSIMAFGHEDSKLWPKLRDSAAAFAGKGGTVLIFPADDAILGDPVFHGLALKPLRTHMAAEAVDADSLLEGVGLQNLHWREPIDFLKIEAGEGSGFKSLLNGLAGKLPYGKGQFIFLQVDPLAFNQYTAATEDDAKLKKPSETALPLSWYAKDRKRSLWQSNRLDSLILANLGAESSSALVNTLFNGKTAIPFYPVDKWVLLGPIPPPSNPNADPIAADFSPLLKDRAFDKPVILASGQSVPWYMPNDFNNGLGVGGMVDLSKPYGVKLKQAALAITYLWSTRDREATFQFGADWWLKVDLNGKEIFRTGSDIRSNSGIKYASEFGFTVKAPLKTGWNEVVCTVGAGTSGNAMWFRVSNPGDTIEEQSLLPPKDPPKLFLRFADGGKYGKMSDAELQESENTPPGFSLYTEPVATTDDPYLYLRW